MQKSPSGGMSSPLNEHEPIARFDGELNEKQPDFKYNKCLAEYESGSLRKSRRVACGKETGSIFRRRYRQGASSRWSEGDKAERIQVFAGIVIARRGSGVTGVLYGSSYQLRRRS